MLKTLTLTEACSVLGFSDKNFDTLINWCKDNKVKIFPKETGRHRFIYATELYSALHGGLIPYIVRKFGEKANEAYEAFLNDDIIRLRMLSRELEDKPIFKKRYVPQSEAAKSFLEKIKKEE
jgi:hypothetical protein